MLNNNVHDDYYANLLQWIERDFLGFFKAWEKSVREREGFTATEQANMLLSAPTRLGIVMTCEDKNFDCF